MVQELQHQPEDFFNLTQLAEVTLIAGKLSTTDINEIRNYINKTEEDCSSENVMMTTAVGKSKSNHNVVVSGYESTKKKWKNHWENFKDREIHTQFNENARVQTYESSPSSSVKTYAFLSSSCSSISSDDDSTKSLLSYSHKVFDRKKQRSFKQSSTESEYEFHFESQRPPYGYNVDINEGGGKNIALHFHENNKDTSKCDNEYLNEHLKIENDLGNQGMMDKNLDSMDGNFEMRNDDHICVECGKKYSTSELKADVTNF